MSVIEGRRFALAAEERERVMAALSQMLDEAPDVACAFVHGSFLRDTPFHDIDVAILFDPEAVAQNPAQISRRALDLAEQLEAAAFGDGPRRPHPPIDVRALNKAPLGFCYEVLRQGRLLSNRDDAVRTGWTAEVVSRYLDIKPLFERALKEAMTTWSSTST